jgi:hypothetical protein
MEAELPVSYCMATLTTAPQYTLQYLENGVFPAASIQSPRGLFPALALVHLATRSSWQPKFHPPISATIVLVPAVVNYDILHMFPSADIWVVDYGNRLTPPSYD